MKIQELVSQYVYDTDNPDLNFWLGVEYEIQGQIAAAVSFYLKTIDTSIHFGHDNPDLVYESWIRIAKCFESLGDRRVTVVDSYKHAISVRPTRPEAYFLLSRHYEVTNYSGHWTDAYQTATVGESASIHYLNYHQPLRTDVGYPGDYALTFQRALSSWWVGKYDLSRELFIRLENWKTPVREEYMGTAKYNLDQVGRGFESPNHVVEKKF